MCWCWSVLPGCYTCVPWAMQWYSDISVSLSTCMNYRCLWNKTLLLREPLPCSPTAETALQPWFGVLEANVFTCFLLRRSVFCPQTPVRYKNSSYDPCTWHIRRTRRAHRATHVAGSRLRAVKIEYTTLKVIIHNNKQHEHKQWFGQSGDPRGDLGPGRV